MNLEGFWRYCESRAGPATRKGAGRGPRCDFKGFGVHFGVPKMYKIHKKRCLHFDVFSDLVFRAFYRPEASKMEVTCYLKVALNQKREKL